MLYIGADKHGFGAVEIITEYLKEKGIDFKNVGIADKDSDIKLEELIPTVVAGVKESPENKGVLICGTGVGVAVGANKFTGIRAALATSPTIAKYSRQYDDCNVLCLVGWDSKAEETKKILEAWLTTEYDGDTDRRKMLNTFDSWR